MVGPTKHQQDLFMDDVIRAEGRLSPEELARKAGLSIARVSSRIDYDIGKGRAKRLPDGRIEFNLSNMADRSVVPFKQ